MLRGFLNTTLLVAIYYVLPLNERFGIDAAVRVLIGLVVFTGLTVWQVIKFVNSLYPAVKALKALGLIVPFTYCSSLRPIS